MQDLKPQGKVSGGRNGRGASGEEGAQPARPWSWAAPHNTHRFTPIEPLHFPCVLGKSETGTKVLRKDKGRGRGRGPGFSACHKGQLSGGGRTWALEHMCLCLRLRGASHCGERSTWGHQVPHLSGEGGGSTRKKEPLISCLRSSSQPTASSICRKKDPRNASPI